MSLRLIHYFTFFHSLGGVQSILARHLEQDPQDDLDPAVVAFFDPVEGNSPRVYGLGLTWRSTIAGGRRAFRRRLPRPAPPVAVYHNGWGLSFFADLDRSERRVVVVHSDWPNLTATLRSVAGRVDGALCVSEPLRNLIRQELPELGEQRIGLLPYPILAAPPARPRAPLETRPLVVGFAGRLLKPQKRIDRLPQVLTALQKVGLEFRFEILGEGPGRAWLERQLSSAPSVRFHGHLTGRDYWSVLACWDLLISTSDYEGLPITLLEAMSTGVIPLFPRIGSGADDYVAALSPELLYPPGDFAALAVRVKRLRGLSSDQLDALRHRAQDLVRPHQSGAYHRQFAEFIHRIAQRPCLSAIALRPRRFQWLDHCPFGILSRIAPHF